ncbi:MAG: hypothetical protein RMN25_13435, partial [Anaerolineae bacterium]|nr:hypothetical protein [Thermoflexales bacterium]MDW8408775.1 hypothetical protein [Anaerolineae bacterium]
PNRLRAVRIDNTEVRAFYTQAEGVLPDIEADLRLVPAQSIDEPARIRGVVVNVSPIALSGCVLAAGRDYLALGDIAASQRVDVDLALRLNRPQPVVMPTEEWQNSGYASFLSARRSVSPASRKPSAYREPFDLDGARVLDMLIGWRDYGQDTVRAAAEGNLVFALFGQPSARLGQGVNLACWHDSAEAGIQVEGARYTDRGLRVWRLPVQTHLAGQGSFLPADVFSWEVRATSSGIRLTEAGLSLSSGQHVIGFSPWLGVRTTGPVTLTLEYVFNPSTRLSDIRETTFWLYDWKTHQYTSLDVLHSGALAGEVSAYGPYVSPAGDVRVRVDNLAGVVTLSTLHVSVRP